MDVHGSRAQLQCIGRSPWSKKLNIKVQSINHTLMITSWMAAIASFVSSSLNSKRHNRRASFWIFTYHNASMSQQLLNIATTWSMQLRATLATIVIWRSVPTSPDILVINTDYVETSKRDKRPVEAMCCLSSQSPVSSLYKHKPGKGIQKQWLFCYMLPEWKSGKNKYLSGPWFFWIAIVVHH